MFGTSGIRGPVGTTVTAGLALSLGRAVASEEYDHVVVGRDVRESGEFLVDAVTAGLRECGATVTRVGVASTPTIARSVGWLGADAGIAVTASHNPPGDNGFKLWSPSGQAFDETRREAIVNRIRSEEYTLQVAQSLGSQTDDESLRDRHVTTLLGALEGADPLDAVVDIGNGTGMVTVDALRALGCRVTTIDAQPDGRFPGRPSEPTAENCRRLMVFVANTDADLGIAHDGDADRMMAVTSAGTWVSGDELLALFARESAEAGDTVAVPVNTSLLVETTLDDVGASVSYTPIGDVHVAERAAEPGVVFGGEPSGTWIWPAETLCPDGHLAACRLVELVSSRGDLTGLVDSLPRYTVHREGLRVEYKEAVMEAIRATVEDAYERVNDLDGVRVDTGDGWFLLRPSGTEPLIRVTAEARAAERAEEIFERARSIVETATGTTR